MNPTSCSEVVVRVDTALSNQHTYEKPFPCLQHLHGLWNPSDGRVRCSWLLLSLGSGCRERCLTLGALVAEASPGGSDDEQRHHDKADRPAQYNQWGRGSRAARCIDGCVKQHRQQEAATGVIEDPRDDTRPRYDGDNELGEGNADAGETGTSSIVSWDEQEQGQVPQAPEHSKNKASH